MATAAEERRENDYQEYEALGARRHWKMTHGTDWSSAYRDFRYPNGAAARVRVDRNVNYRVRWEAGVRLPFSEDSEVSHTDPRFGPVREWAIQMEALLEVPLLIAATGDLAKAEDLTRRIDRATGWALICAVFDMNHGHPADSLREQLVTHVAPHLAGARR